MCCARGPKDIALLLQVFNRPWFHTIPNRLLQACLLSGLAHAAGSRAPVGCAGPDGVTGGRGVHTPDF
eukprot:9309691-Pyramimonas_sp.AAC.1